MLLRTRRARRSGDAAAVLRALARGADTAAGFTLGGRKVLLLLTPELAGRLLVEHADHTVKGPGLQRTRPLLGNGLLTSEGEDHRRARRLVAPAFSPRRLTGYAEVFTRRTIEHVADWTDDTTLDLYQEMATLTLDIVGRTLLGIDLSADTTGIRAALESALATFAAGQTGFATRLQTPARARATATTVPDQQPDQAPIHALVDQLIETRRADPSPDRGDVVSTLLASSTAPGGLSASELHDHVITLLVAGHETTATALAWTLHLLGQHPHVERRLHRELAGPAGAGYARAVITESMRVYPPAWIIGRSLDTDVDFGAWHAPAGTIVAVSPLLLHHDPRWFPDPQTFDPDRWLDGRRAAVPRHAYLPFGTGPRACIGEQFAWAEATAVLSAIATRWSARTPPGHTVDAQYRVTMRPAGGLPMTVHAR